jgi:DHA2 family multidrug resistance protein
MLLAILGFGLFGTALIMPLFFQSIAGMSAFEVGQVLLPGAIATAVSMIIAGRLVGRIDGRILIAFGTALFALSTWMLGGLNENTGYWDVFYPRVLQGFALGFLFVPLSTVMLAPVPREELSGASGVSNLVRQIGGSLGIAILYTMLTRETAVAWSTLAGGVTSTHGYSIQALTGLVAQGSSVIGYDYLFRLTAVVFIATLPLVFFMRPPKVASGGATPAMAE